MNENPSGDGGATGTPARTRSFRKWQPALVLTPAQTRRQSDVLRYAHQNLASPDITVAFLNSYNKQLDGVPLQLALQSDEGLLGVEQLLMKMKGTTDPVARVDPSQ
jgi:hypothetical protein